MYDSLKTYRAFMKDVPCIYLGQVVAESEEEAIEKAKSFWGCFDKYIIVQEITEK